MKSRFHVSSRWKARQVRSASSRDGICRFGHDAFDTKPSTSWLPSRNSRSTRRPSGALSSGNARYHVSATTSISSMVPFVPRSPVISTPSTSWSRNQRRAFSNVVAFSRFVTWMSERTPILRRGLLPQPAVWPAPCPPPHPPANAAPATRKPLRDTSMSVNESQSLCPTARSLRLRERLHLRSRRQRHHRPA